MGMMVVLCGHKGRITRVLLHRSWSMSLELIIQWMGVEAYKAALYMSTALLQWIGFGVLCELCWKRWMRPLWYLMKDKWEDFKK